ncbi:mimecan isoform 1-T2 [Discoglossus pictus]
MQAISIVCMVTLLLPSIHSAPPAPQEFTDDYDADFMVEGLLFKKHFEANSQESLTDKETGLIVAPHGRYKRDEEKPTEESKEGDVDLPTCLLCVCIRGSVYCEETEIESVPPLPKETTYLYARFNKIKKITAKDFADFPTLRRIDLTGNLIEEIEENAFDKLELLDQLSLAENKLIKIPALPTKLTAFNANNNMIESKGIQENAFEKLTNLAYLYLADNALESVPQHLPESLRILHLQNNNITSISDNTFCRANDTRYVRTKMDQIRMEGNPVILGKYPNSFTCLKVLPTGSYFK